VRWITLIIVLVLPRLVSAQEFSYRGFTEVRSIFYPQTTPHDDDRLAVEARVRFEPAYRPAEWLTLSASTEARLDNLKQVDRARQIDWNDRGIRRSAFGVRQATATLRRGGLIADIGKQFIRWGKADILTPTDRFAPRDFLEVTADEFLGVTGARLQYAAGSHSFDAAWLPRFTPSRIPLFDRRWAAVPPNVGEFTLVDGGTTFPNRSQVGIRWNVIRSGYDFSFSYFDGFNHLPELSLVLLGGPTPIEGEGRIPDEDPTVLVTRSYVPLTMFGSDGALTLRWFTLKGEAAFLKTTSGVADDVVMYVVQVERQSGELNLVAGYAGEVITKRRSTANFAPDRGLAHALLWRASYTIDANRSVSLEEALRETFDAAVLKLEYSETRGAHWRTTVGGTLIVGKMSDFLGQYRRNSHLLATLRYSF
jgi:hypothetical protein